MKPTFFAFAFAAILISSCSDQKTCTYKSIQPENGNDIQLSIIQQNKVGSYYELILKGCYLQDSVGVKLCLKDSIPAENKENSNLSFIDKGVRMESTGAESNRLLESICKINQLEPAGNFSASPIEFGIYSQANTAVDYSKNAYRMLLINSPKQAPVNQYITFDFTNRQVIFIHSGKEELGNFLLSLAQ